MKITWNESETACTDENGNKATIAKWVDKERAEASLKSLSGCSDCSDCSDCSACSDCSRCSDCKCCGILGRYIYFVCGDTAKVGCKTFKISQWREFTKDEVSEMAGDAADWYDKNWKAWMALLDAYEGVGVHIGDAE